MDADTNRTLLHEAAKLGYATIIDILVKAGAEVNARDTSGRTALMESAWEAHAGATRALLRGGADSEAENHGGGTALKVAMRRKHKGGDVKTDEAKSVIRMLTDHRIKQNKVSEKEKAKYKDYKWHRDPDWKWKKGGETGPDSAEL
ncbi:ankyrin repeat-containing domain protein [Baffinella frigidus]|nr:ankyrin repeat-containing domain protein [Cryptophyta sp. CCMP2293]